MAGIVKVPGIEKTLGGEVYVVPPLSLGALQQLQARISSFQEGKVDSETIATVLDAAHAALKRNYPDITMDQVAEMVDLGNMFEVFEAVMDVSGLRRKALLTEAATQGELAPGEK